MRTVFQRIGSVWIVVLVTSAAYAQMDHGHSMVIPEKILWMDAPPSFPPGAQITVLKGDMRKEESFIVRAKLPANYRIMPHWHPADEHITVIEGTFYMEIGDQFKENDVMEIPAGGLAVMNTGTRHF